MAEVELSEVAKKKKKKKGKKVSAEKAKDTKVKKKKKKKSKTDKAEKAVSANVVPYGKDNYVILDINGKKKLAIAFTKGKALLEDGIENEDTAETVSFEAGQVLACLGPNPEPGSSVMGVSINPYEGSLKVKGFGKINYYRKMKKRELRYLKEVIEDCHAVLKKNKATDFLPLASMQVFTKFGKSEIGYKSKAATKNNPDAPTDTFIIMPETLTEKTYLANLIYLLCSKAIWKHQIPDDIKARWVTLFSKRTEIHTVDQNLLDTMFTNLTDFLEEHPNAQVKDFANEYLEDEDKAILTNIFDTVKRIHKLKTDELITVYRQKGKKSMVKFWPTSADFSEQIADIDEDSAKSVDNFFVSAFTYHLSGKSIPKDVAKLIQRTLKNMIRTYK